MARRPISNSIRRKRLRREASTAPGGNVVTYNDTPITHEGVTVTHGE